MNPIKKILILAALPAMAAQLEAEPFSLFFSFDDNSPAVDEASSEVTVSDFMGGTVSDGSLSAAVTPSTNAVFSFDLAIDPAFTGVAQFAAFTTTFTGSVAATYALFFEDHLITAGFTTALFPSFSVSVPSIDIGSGGTFSIVATSLLGQTGEFSLHNFGLIGSLVPIPETSTALLGGTSALFVLALGFIRRRKQAAQTPELGAAT